MNTITLNVVSLGEIRGIPAMLPAIPIVNGFMVAAANPVATDTNTIPPPTNLSYPKVVDQKPLYLV